MQDFNIEVTTVDIQVLAEIQSQSILERENFESINLSAYLSGIDVSNVTWKTSGAENISPSVTENLLEFTIPNDYYGDNLLTVKAINAAHTSVFDERAISLNFLNVNDAPEFITIPAGIVLNVGDKYNQEISAEDIDNIDLSMYTENLPNCLILTTNKSLAILSGLATKEVGGVYAVEVGVTDGIDSTEVIIKH